MQIYILSGLPHLETTTVHTTIPAPKIAAPGAPISEPPTLTPKGDAVRLLYRLVAALGVLPDDDRQAVLALLSLELADMRA